MKKLPTIIIDTREQAPLRFGDGVTVERRKLVTGDYTLEGYEMLLCIERKSLVDLYGSILTKRFKNVIERMCGYAYAFLVIEATYEDVITKNHWKLRKLQQLVRTVSATAIIGKCISMQSEGIQVVFIDAKRTAQYVQHLCEYFSKKFEKEKKPNG